MHFIKNSPYACIFPISLSVYGEGDTEGEVGETGQCVSERGTPLLMSSPSLCTERGNEREM